MVSRPQFVPALTAAHTIADMRGWSFPIGRFLGVDVRIHTFFLLLLGLSISYASMTGATGARGFVLWLLLLLAVVVREIARAIGAAWFGLELRSILLLPTGGLHELRDPRGDRAGIDPRDAKAHGRHRTNCEYRVRPAAGRDRVDIFARSQPLRTALDVALSPAAGRGVDESSAGRGKSAACLAARWRTRLSRRVCKDKRRDQRLASRSRTGSDHRHRH